MKIEKNLFVELAYELRSDSADGALIEKTADEAPLRFVFGSGKMLEKFEQKILGLEAGQAFDFVLAPSEAYGEVNPELIVDIPKNVFVVNGQLRDDLLRVGGRVPMMGEGGRRIDGIVLEVTDDNVKMDFNHPLSGETLHFSGKINEVREATAEELIDGIGGHRCGGGCGGGCGDGDGGCGGGCGGDGGCGGGCNCDDDDD